MRRAVVTGGSKGIGLAVARRLARDGLAVVATYAHDDDAARAAESALRDEKLDVTMRKCDIADGKQVEQLFVQLRDANAEAEVFVHSAGITRDKLLMMMPEQDFDDVIAVHLRGLFLGARQAVRGMIAKKHGRIISIVSPTGILGRAGQTNYGAAKAGMIGLTKSLAREVARFKITVNAVCAGLVDTALTSDISEKARAEMMAAIPLGRTGTAEEIAAAVTWLASDASSYVTGQVLGVDGGLT
jgi:3-oxoacyl-[acyl-carrier protein] reductase